MNFSKEEYKARLKKVQSSMQEKGIELLISSDTANMNYLTGYDAWSFYYAQAVIVHVNADEPLCWVRKQDSGGAYIKTYLKHENILGIKKISIFTPYTKTINDSVVNYFEKENISINSLTYFDIESDLDIGKELILMFSFSK